MANCTSDPAFFLGCKDLEKIAEKLDLDLDLNESKHGHEQG